LIKRLLKDPLFIAGFSIILILLVASFILTKTLHGDIPRKMLLYDKHGNLIDQAPLSPLLYPPFGTDRQGYSLFYRLMIGAKYTICIALLIAGLRLILSLLFGLIYGIYFTRLSRFLPKLIDAFSYVPMTLLAYILLSPVIMENSVTSQFQYSPAQRIGFEIAILTVIAIPTASLFFGNETQYILNQDYMAGVKILGASRFHILKRHVLPHLAPKIWVHFAQQMIQVLVILIHLGLLKLFFGGTFVANGIGVTEYSSMSGEWSGLIGSSFNELTTTPWIPFAPLIMFTITLISMQLILRALQSAVEKTGPSPRRKKANVHINKETPAIRPNDFTFLG
jgi:peptide/nickel transport system permease protein